MLVALVGIPEGVTQKGHADLAGNTEFKQAGVEGVAQVMEPDIPDSRPADSSFPAGLHASNGLAFEGEDQTRVLLPVRKQVEDPFGQRNLAGFSLGRLAVRDIQEPPFEVHVFPGLAEDLAPAHAGLEGKNGDRPQVGRCGRKELGFLGEAQDRLLLAALPFEPNAGNGVCGKDAFVHRPIEQVAEAFDVAVDRRFGEPLFRVALLAVASDEAFRNPADLGGREKRQKHLQPVAVPLLWRSLVQEPARELREEHLGFQIGKLRRFEADFFLVLLIDLLCKPAVTGSRRACMADAILPDVAPVHVAALE
jgi:hypothetical protein